MMDSLKPWASALQISRNTYQGWAIAAPKNESMTYWCLITDKIKSDEYLNWAKDHYELPVLDTLFFKQKPNLEIWNQIKPVANWSAKMIPLQEWDGVVFVACVEPHSEVNWSFPVQYVLAAAQDLETYWKALNATEEKSYAIPVVTAPVALAPAFGAPAPTPEPVTEISDEPAGLNLSKFGQIKAPKTIDPMEALTLKFGSKAPTADLDMPDNLVWNPDNANTEALIAPQGMAPVVTAPKQAAAPMSGTNQNFISVIQEMKNYFKGAMILSVNNDNAVSETWDAPFRPVNENVKKPWNLNSPSALRIAYRTKQAYLGHIVDTPMNREFFNSWGFNELPKSVLIQPVMSANTVTHLLIATVDESKPSHQTLHEGKNFSDKVSQMSSSARAA